MTINNYCSNAQSGIIKTLQNIPLRFPEKNRKHEKLVLGGNRIHEVRSQRIRHHPGAFGIDASGKECAVKSCDADKIVGTNGAGDAFCAGGLYTLHEEEFLEEMLKYGGASAKFNLRSASASGGVARLEEINTFFAQH